MRKVNLLLTIFSVILWIALSFFLNVSYASLVKISDKPLLDVDGFLGENMIISLPLIGGFLVIGQITLLNWLDLLI